METKFAFFQIIVIAAAGLAAAIVVGYCMFSAFIATPGF